MAGRPGQADRRHGVTGQGTHCGPADLAVVPALTRCPGRRSRQRTGRAGTSAAAGQGKAGSRGPVLCQPRRRRSIRTTMTSYASPPAAAQRGCPTGCCHNPVRTPRTASRTHCRHSAARRHTAWTKSAFPHLSGRHLKSHPWCYRRAPRLHVACRCRGCRRPGRRRDRRCPDRCQGSRPPARADGCPAGLHRRWSGCACG